MLRLMLLQTQQFRTPTVCSPRLGTTFKLLDPGFKLGIVEKEMQPKSTF
jgi:hypothetical protein